MFTSMRLIILSDMLLNPSFKMTTSFANVAQLAQVNLYTRTDIKSSGIGSLYEKYFLTLNELKTGLIFLYKSLCEVSKVYFLYGAKVGRYMVILNNKCQMCLLVDFGY